MRAGWKTYPTGVLWQFWKRSDDARRRVGYRAPGDQGEKGEIWAARGGPMQVRNLGLSRKRPESPQIKYLDLAFAIMRKSSSSRALSAKSQTALPTGTTVASPTLLIVCGVFCRRGTNLIVALRTRPIPDGTFNEMANSGANFSP